MGATTRLEFRDDNYAELRAPEDVSERKRRAIRTVATTMLGHREELEGVRLMLAGGVAETNVPLPSSEVIDALSSVMDHIIVAFVKEWSFGQVTLDVLLDDVPGDIYNELRDATAPMFKEIMPDMGVDGAVAGVNPNTGAPILDRSSPTPPSVA